MTGTVLPLLQSSIRLGTAEARNRLLMSGLHLGFEGGESPFEEMAAFFARRASAGIGTLVVGGCSPDRPGRAMPRGFTIASDDLIPEHEVVTSAIRRNGSLSILQLCPFGRESFHSGLVAPSAVRAHSNPFVPAPLSAEAIEESLERFTDAIVRARTAGYDGVEIVGSQGFLIHQFLAARTNRRDDGWGGILEGRARYALDVVERGRRATDGTFPIIFRVPALDLVEGGLTPEEVRTLVGWLVDRGVALLNVGIGWHDSKVPTISMEVPEAAFAGVAKAVRGIARGTPVAVSNRINDLRTAERLLEEGVADMIAMGRPLLADPDILLKSVHRQWHLVNTCIACNQDCLDNAIRGRRVGCIVNPEAGRETAKPIRCRPDSRVRIAVVGGGLAGMSAALWLRRTGHEVLLFERQSCLGGQLKLAERVPGKQLFAETARYFEAALREEGVRIGLGQTLLASELDGLGADHIVWAAGAVPRRPLVAVSDATRFYSYEEAIAEGLPLGRRIAIIGSGAIAVDLVKYLTTSGSDRLPAAGSAIRNAVDQAWGEQGGRDSRAGKLYMIARSGKAQPGRTIGISTRWIARSRIENSCDILTNVEILSVASDGLVTRNRSTGETTKLHVDGTIYAIGQVPSSLSPADLAMFSTPVTEIGLSQHAAGRYNAGAAIKQGYNFAMQVGASGLPAYSRAESSSRGQLPFEGCR